MERAMVSPVHGSRDASIREWNTRERDQMARRGRYRAVKWPRSSVTGSIIEL